MKKQYAQFLEAKIPKAQQKGLMVIPELANHLFSFQKHCVDFALRVGSAGVFLSTGLGKTAIQLEWCKHAAQATNGWALILTPLAVARQIETEGNRWGYNIRVIRSQDDAAEGINVCNYDRLDKLQPDSFGAVALDEGSIIKNFSGKTTRALIEAFANHRFKISATATPAPNDHMELTQQSEFLSAMAREDLLPRFFIHDSADTNSWRLKGHAVNAFWDWVASWARMAIHPRDLGDDQPGFDLPDLSVIPHRLDVPVEAYGSLFAESISATEMHRIKRDSATARAESVAELAADSADTWVIWCDTDYEADAIMKALNTDEAVEIRGSHTIERKEDSIGAFTNQTKRILVTKPSICAHGLNLQFCNHMAFVGRTFSYESYYQAIRRCWRFGQKKHVQVHLIVTESEDAISRVLDRKADDHNKMNRAMADAMIRAMARSERPKQVYNPNYNGRLPKWIKESNVSESNTAITTPPITVIA